jgi:hypothetical protein
MSDMRQFQLSEELCGAAERKFAGRFRSVEELLVFVLRDLTADDAFQADHAEQHIIEERLRELGYI